MKNFSSFVIPFFAGMMLFSGCGFNSENSNDECRDVACNVSTGEEITPENIDWLPAYHSFDTEKIYVPISPEDSEEKFLAEKLPAVFSDKKENNFQKFEGEVFVNDTKIYGKSGAEKPEYKVFEEKFFSEKGVEKFPTMIGGDFHMYFSENVLQEGDVLKIIPESENPENSEKIEWKYEDILFTNLNEIKPEISYTENSVILKFPFSLEESKIARIKNFFEISTSIWKDVNNIKNDEKVLFNKHKKIAQFEEVKNLKIETSYNVKNEEVTIQIPKSELPENFKNNITLSVMHYGSQNNSVNIQIQKNNFSVKLGETFKKSENFASDIEIEFSGNLFEDKGQNGSPEFIENRKIQKQKFLENISIIPKINPEISEENLFLTPNKAVITAVLQPETSYNIKFSGEILDKINPIPVGREVKRKFEFLLETGKFSTRGIEMKDKQTLFSSRKMPEISVYTFPKPEKNLKNSENTRDIMICKISAEEYEKFEDFIDYDWNFEQFYKEKFIPKYSHPEYFKDEKICTIKTVDFTKPENLKFSENNLGAGMYFVSFVGHESKFTEAPYRSSYEKKNNKYSSQELSREEKNDWEKSENEMNFIRENILLFSVVDTHITLKSDMKNNDFFWVTDEKTGKNAEGVEIFIQKSEWKNYTDENGKSRNKKIFSEISLGKTDKSGVLKVNRGGRKYKFGSNILRFVAKKDGKFSGIVSSSWNAGIAAWNFGMDNSGYDKASKKFLAHMVPDRKLYEPGEKMFVKAVVRKDAETLKIPDQKSEYILKLMNPKWETISTKTVSPNEFGSVFFEYEFPKTAQRGSYQVVLNGSNDDGKGEEFEIARISVDVQDFILPTFEVNVGLENNDENNVSRDKLQFVSTEKEKNNSEPEISGKISLKYFSGGSMPTGKFSYKLYKKPHYEEDYWDYCYWGCYYNSSKSYVGGGQGEIKNGAGEFAISRPLLDELNAKKYEYIAEVTVSDQTGERITGSGSVIVDSIEFENAEKSLQFQIKPEKNFFTKGEDGDLVKITLQANQEFIKNDAQRLFIVHREYATKYFKDISGNMRAQNNFEDFIENRISINTENFKFNEKGQAEFSFTPQKTGEYRLYTKGYSTREYPEIQKIYILPKTEDEVMNMPVLDDLKINLIQEKFEYKIGETARILVQSPFKKGTAFVTIEKDEVISHEEISLENNVTLLEIPVDEKFVPNAYVSVVVKNESGSEYRLGYAEIIVGESAKKLSVELKTDKEIYSPRDTVKLKISAKNQKGEGEISEFSVAVIDESLISMIGNINMDVLKSFYEKIPFSINTAMTNVAMKKNMYFSRRGIIGGSGSKGGGSASIFTRSLFKKTAFYKGDVKTDKSGVAHIEFQLPDNTGQFRIVVIGNSKANFFGAGEKVINVHQDVVIEEQFPIIFRRGDKLVLEANVFNNTAPSSSQNFSGATAKEKYVGSKFSVNFSSKDIEIENPTQEIEIPAGERKKVSWAVEIPENLSLDIHDINFEITAISKNNKKLGDKIQKKITLATTPLISQYEKTYFSLDSKKSSAEIFRKNEKINPNLSTIEISVGTVPQLGLENVLSSLAQYPHGCLEQTTSSTLPNALLLSFSEILDIKDFDEEKKKQTQKNVESGIERIFSMQLENGGFAYWQGETTVSNHYSPYAIWGLAKLKELGYLTKPEHEKKLKKAEDFLREHFHNYSPEKNNCENAGRDVACNVSTGENSRAELVESLRALAVLKSDFFLKATQIITTEKDKFSDHEKIMYALALLEYDAEKYSDASKWLLSQIDTENMKSSGYYYGTATDEVLLAQAWQYIDANSEISHKLIDKIKAYNLKSYFYSTATKNQSFLAFLQHLKAFDIGAGRDELQFVSTDVEIYSGEKLLKTISLTPEKTHEKIMLSYAEISEKNQKINLKIVSKNQKIPVFVMIVSQTTPEKKTDILAKSSGGITVKREIFEINDVLASGEKIATHEYERQKISGKNIGLRMGKKYKVRITVASDENARDIAVESYLPSGIKVLNSAFKNNESVSRERGDYYWNTWWDHKETKKDMVFASDSYFYEAKVLEYTFVPTQEGEFYFPSVLAYAMYQPENRANTEYVKMSVGR